MIPRDSPSVGITTLSIEGWQTIKSQSETRIKFIKASLQCTMNCPSSKNLHVSKQHFVHQNNYFGEGTNSLSGSTPRGLSLLVVCRALTLLHMRVCPPRDKDKSVLLLSKNEWQSATQSLPALEGPTFTPTDPACNRTEYFLTCASIGPVSITDSATTPATQALDRKCSSATKKSAQSFPEGRKGLSVFMEVLFIGWGPVMLKVVIAPEFPRLYHPFYGSAISKSLVGSSRNVATLILMLITSSSETAWVISSDETRSRLGLEKRGPPQWVSSNSILNSID